MDKMTRKDTRKAFKYKNYIMVLDDRCSHNYVGYQVLRRIITKLCEWWLPSVPDHAITSPFSDQQEEDVPKKQL